MMFTGADAVWVFWHCYSELPLVWIPEYPSKGWLIPSFSRYLWHTCYPEYYSEAQDCP